MSALASRIDLRAHGGRRTLAVWTLCTLVAGLSLMAPALWNGFPIVFTDTGGYIEAALGGTLATGRSAFYGAILAAGRPLHFWPVIVAQAALMIWLTILTLRVLTGRACPWATAALLVTLSLVTGLAWYTAQLMPDILVPAAVLALGLLGLCRDRLNRWEALALAALIAASAASHMAIAALALAMLALLALARVVRPMGWPPPALLLPVAGVVAGFALSIAANAVLTGRTAATPGGFNFIFGRMMQDGIAARYLADRCPDPTIRLCAHRNDLPAEADSWLWAPESPIYALGGHAAFEPEARRIVLESLKAYPGMQLRTAVWATIQQFASVLTGDGIVPWNHHFQWTLEQFVPNVLPAYLASHQAAGPMDFRGWNLIHLPALALMVSLLPAVVLLTRAPRLAAFAAFIFVALWMNAAIGGVLANPHDRYQSRLAWIAGLVLAAAVIGERQRRTSRQALR